MNRSLPFLALLAFASLLRAQPAPAPALAAPEETVITATKGEIWSNEATGTNLRITCDRIEATAVGKNENSAVKNSTARDVEKFKTIIATGKVRIVQGDREANCERAEVLPRESKIILSGQPVVIDRGTGSVATGEPLVLLKDQRRVQGDNVKITFPPIPDLGFDKNAPAPKPDDAKP
jgi:lipopolysaccharide export system protein LptA